MRRTDKIATAVFGESVSLTEQKCRDVTYASEIRQSIEDRRNSQVSNFTPVTSGHTCLSLSRDPAVIRESSGAVFPPIGHALWHFLSAQKSSVGRVGNASSPRPCPVSGKLKEQSTVSRCCREKSCTRAPSYPDANSSQFCWVPTSILSTWLWRRRLRQEAPPPPSHPSLV